MYVTNQGEIKKTFVKQPYNYDMDEESEETGLKCLDKTLAQQQFKEETDINTIVKRFGITGELPKDVRVPTNQDIWEVQDYQGALNQINAGREAFMQMPAHIREEFGNDPAEFVNFVSDEHNRSKAEALGIVIKKEEVPKEEQKT